MSKRNIKVKNKKRNNISSLFKTFFLFFTIIPVILFFVLSSRLFVRPTFAASGINPQINFQGKLVDDNGLNVANNTYSVIFSLYNVSSGGTAAWTETDSVTTSNGIFQVALGANTSLAGFDFNQNTWYLGIKVGSDAEMTPRVRFTAVPYAFNAASLDGIVATNSASSFTLTGGTNGLKTLTVNDNITIGSTITPTTAGALTLESNGANTLTLDAGGAAAINIGTTNANAISLGNVSQNTTLTLNGTGLTSLGGGLNVTGSVGIGTTSPVAKIDIRGNAYTTNVASISGATGKATLQIDQSGIGDIFTASQSGGTRFVIKNNGNVGIGTSIPSMPLQVNGNVLFGTPPTQSYYTVAPLNMSNNQGSALKTQLNLINGGGGGGAGSAIDFYTYTDVSNSSGPGSRFGAIDDGNYSGSFVFYTKTPGAASNSIVERMRIASGGNVGVGTTNPGSLVSIYSTASSSQGSPNPIFSITSTNGGSGGSANAIDFNTYAAAGAGSGNAPSARITALDDNYAADLIFSTKNQGAAGNSLVERMRLLGSGYFGIGSTAPSVPLDVNYNSNSNSIGFSIANADTSIWGYTQMRYHATGRDYYTGVGNASETNIGVANKFYIFDNNASAMRFVVDTSGNVGIGTNNVSPLAKLDVRASSSYTTPVASISGATGKATLQIDQSGVGDLITASQSGGTRFRLTNNGSIYASKYTTPGGVLFADANGLFTQTSTGLSSQCLVGGTTPAWSSCSGLGTNYWQINGSILSPYNTTLDLTIGGTATGSAFQVFGGANGTIPAGTASTSGYLSFAGAGTAHKVNLLQNGTLGFYNSVGGDAGTTGNPALFINNNGNVGIGTNNPTSSLYVSGDIKTTTDIYSFSLRNFDSQNNGRILLTDNGISIDRNIADANPALIIQQRNASSTGDILDLKNSGSTPVMVVSQAGQVGVGTTSFANANTIFQVYDSAATDQQPIVVFGDGSSSTRYQFLADRGGGASFQMQSGAATISTYGTLNLQGGNGASSLFITGTLGNIGIGTTSNLGNAQLVVNQTDLSGNGDIFAASASGASKFVIKNDGSVGIGTTNPTVSFDVQNSTEGLIRAADANGNGPIGSYLMGNGGSSNGYKMGLGNNFYWNGSNWVTKSDNAGGGSNGGSLILSGYSPADIGFYTLPSNGGGSGQTVSNANIGNYVRMTIKESGNIGVGTTNPGALLDLRLPSTSSQNNMLGIGNVSGGLYGTLGFTSGGTAPFNVFGYTGDDLALGANNTEFMRITQGGNVGIGTSSPLATLDVRGSAYTTPVASISGATGKATLQIDQSGVGDLITASQSGGTRFRLTNNGSIYASKYTTPGGILFADSNGLFTQTGTSVSTQCLIGGTTPSWATCNTLGYWQLNNKILSPYNATLDLTIGGTATGSAFQVFGGANGTIPAGTASTSGYLSFAGAGTAHKVNLLQNGTLGFYNSVGGDAGTTGNPALYIANNGYIGIGTTNPSDLLNIVKNNGSDLNVIFQNSSSGKAAYVLTLANSNYSGLVVEGTGQQWNVGMNGGTNFSLNDATNNKTPFSIVSGAPDNSLYIASTGKIGLGTTTPADMLHLSGDSSGNPGTIESNIRLDDIHGDTGSRNWMISNGSTDYGTFEIMSGTSAGAAPSTTRFIISKEGNVGIGTTAPNAKTEIIASGNATNTEWNTTNGLRISTGETSSDYSLYMGADATNHVSYLQSVNVGTDVAPIILNARGGSVGIGTTSPNNVLDIYNAQPLVYYDRQGNYQWQAGMDDATYAGTSDFIVRDVNYTAVRFDVQAVTGNVGIGTTNPYATLDVAGNALFQGSTVASIGTGASGTGSNAIANAIGDQGSMVPNAGFESAVIGAASGTNFADGWVVAATNSAAVTRDTTLADLNMGDANALVTLTNSSAAFYSSCFPLAGTAGNYVFNYYAKGSRTGITVRAYIDQYTTRANCQSDTSAIFSAPVDTTAKTAAWVKYGANTTAVTLDSSTRWARAHFFVACAVACSGVTMNIDGVRLTQSTVGQGLDYAEDYPIDPNNPSYPGQIVSLSTKNGIAEVVPSNTYMDNQVFGIVSTNPGEVLDDGSVPDPKVPVALSGRVPVNVSTQNGPIHAGDYLTSSIIPGVAVKATQSGQVIGIAMEDDTNADPTAIAQITTFIKNTYFDGNLTPGLSGNTQLANLIGTSAASSIQATTDGKIIINADHPENAITFDNLGNATFAGVVSAKAIQAGEILGLDDKLASLSSALASSSAQTSGVQIHNLSVAGLATVSADLRVKGNSLIEGILAVVDTIKANNFIATGVADFFDSVIFHGDTNFVGRPTFNSDTAGFATIKKDTDHVDVIFSREYDATPVVTATITVDQNTSTSDQNALEQTILNNGYTYIITNKTTKGFTILLNKKATINIPFSWVTLSVDSAQASQNVSDVIVSPTEIPVSVTPSASSSALMP